jgi:hypothetical protein
MRGYLEHVELMGRDRAIFFAQGSSTSFGLNKSNTAISVAKGIAIKSLKIVGSDRTSFGLNKSDKVISVAKGIALKSCKIFGSDSERECVSPWDLALTCQFACPI